MKHKVTLAVSACLLGQRVRYDGRQKRHSLIVKLFENQFFDQIEVVPFCPEVAIGLGVPRPKIQVVKSYTEKNKNEQIRVLGVENHRLDYTDSLKSYAEIFLQQFPDIKGIIVKSKSPSCGFQSTPLFTKQAGGYQQIDLTSGVFVQSLLRLKPDLLISDESQLDTESACLTFVNRVL